MDKERGLFGVKNRIYLVFTALLIIVLTLEVVGFWYFNLPPEGFCKPENRRLSDKERIEKAARLVMNDFPQVFHRETWQGKPHEGEFADGDWWLPSGKADGGGVQMEMPSYPLPFKDTKDFFLLNPNCCHLTQNYRPEIGELWDSVSDWDRLTGKKATIVVVKWRLRYMGSNGVLQVKDYERGLAQDNCGNLVHEYID